MRIAICVAVVLSLLFLDVEVLMTQGRISGLTYVDYFYNIKGDISNYPGTSNQGFQFRRGCFTYNHRISNFCTLQ